MHCDGRKPVEVCLILFNDHERCNMHSLCPLIPIVGTGLGLNLNKEVTFRTLGVLVAHGEGSAPWITFVSSHFSDIFPQLLSFFEWSILTQLESPNARHLFFVALDVYCNTQEGKINRNFLL